MANIARLGVVLGIDSAEFVSGIERAEKKLKEFASAALDAGKIAATALVAASAAALRYADEIADVAKANEVSIDSIVKLQNALANSGGKADSAGKLLASFTQTIDKAAEGSFETQKVFKMLGLSLDDLSKLSIDELFKRTVKELAAMDDPITRNAKAMEFFGKAAKGVDFVELNEQLEKGTNLTIEQQKSIENAAAAYDVFAQSARNFGLVLATDLGTPLKTTMDYLSKIAGTSNAFGVMEEAFKGIAVGVGALALLVQNLSQNLAAISNLEFGKIFGNSTKNVEDYKAFVREIYGEKNRRESSGIVTDAFPKEPAPLRTVVEGVDKAAAEAARIAKQAADERKRINERAVREREKLQKESDDRLVTRNKEVNQLYLESQREIEKRQKYLAAAYKEQQDQIDEITSGLAEQDNIYRNTEASLRERQRLESMDIDRQKQMLDLLYNGRNLRAAELDFEKEKLQIQYRQKDAIEAIEKAQLTPEARLGRIERENELAREAVELARQRLDYANKEREGTAAEGFMSAAGRAFRDAKTDFEMGQQAFESVIGNMESAILRFVQTGKFSFKDLARSIIADLIAMQVRAQALSIFKMILGSIGSSGVGGTTGPDNIDVGGGWSPAGRAAGGSVGANTMYMVGERGPELFVPQSAGTIIPNNSMANMMGGGQTVNYNGPVIQNMNAIDTQSGIQFLSKNKSTIWAANQSAQRSLPMSR